MRRVICLFCLPVWILAQLFTASFTVEGAQVSADVTEATAENEAGADIGILPLFAQI